MKIVRVLGGADRVSGPEHYHFYTDAVLFETRKAEDGRWVWVDTGVHTQRRDTYYDAMKDGMELAVRERAVFQGVELSLHGVPVKGCATPESFLTALVDRDDEEACALPR